MKRSPIRRKRAKLTDAPKHLAWLREQPCCLGYLYACSGVVESHHSTLGRGLSQKSSDLDAMPLCARHHFCLHNFTGFFAGWSREQRAEWQRTMSAAYRPREETG